MMKCDLCYDRTSVGKKPMCATVCPSGALFYGSREEVDQLRPRSTPVDRFLFGGQPINTRVNILAPRKAPPERVDILSVLNEPPLGQTMELNLV
jgi:Fe-S-cluster-containing dehydrogenase component